MDTLNCHTEPSTASALSDENGERGKEPPCQDGHLEVGVNEGNARGKRRMVAREAGVPLGSYCHSVRVGSSTSSPGLIFLICAVRVATRLASLLTIVFSHLEHRRGAGGNSRWEEAVGHF